MVIYEVNLTVQLGIWSEYTRWLAQHIEQILLLKGFEWADVFEVLEPPAEGARQICVQYHLKNEKALQSYFKHQADEMRQDAIERFGDQFSATRRILTPLPEGGLLHLAE